MKKSLLLLLLFLVSAQLALAQTAKGNITNAECITIAVDKQATVGIQVAGTWTGTLQPKISIQGQTAANIQVTPSTSSTAQATITGNGVFRAVVAGGSVFSVCGNTVATGTANVFLNASTASAGLSGGGGGTVTNVTATAPVTSSGGATPDIACPTCVTTPDLGFALNAGCKGTIGASNATSYIMDPGSTSTNCTTTHASVNTNFMNPLPVACTAQKLFVRAGAAGAVAGSVVVTVFKNNVATTITCTLGTGQSCNDTTHTVAFAQGDGWSVEVLTGQASDTTANLRIGFLCL